MSKYSAVLFGVALRLLMLMPAPAHALVTVVGDGLAHDCFLMAKAGNDPSRGIATCDEALTESALDAHARAGTYINRAVMKVALGRVDDAMGDYNEGIAIKPDLGDGYVDRGAALIQLKRYDDAMAGHQQGDRVGPLLRACGVLRSRGGRVLHGAASPSGPYYDYKKALEIEPDFQPAAEQLKIFVVTRVPAKPEP